MWNNDKDRIMAMIKPMIDEKIGGKKSKK